MNNDINNASSLEQQGETPASPQSFKDRVAAVKRTRWIRFAIVSIIFFAWVAWLGSWWVAIFWFLLFDIYITGYIPLTWWKKSKNATTRAVMSWVDAIVYALVLVYFVFAFIGQNYQIPSSSLEKTLLVGDYLWVNKMSYGPRVPNTPLHFPLVQHTIPVLNTKSYIEWPQWSYHRLKGLGNVERGDIVVFNFPAGDTVALGQQSIDYYTLKKIYSDELKANPELFGKVVYRPVDRRENYVKRAIGLPGESLYIKDGVVYINDKPLQAPVNRQFNYWVQLPGNSRLSPDDFERLGISVDDRHLVAVEPEAIGGWQYIGFKIDTSNLSANSIYGLPLTDAMVNTLEGEYGAKVVRIPAETGPDNMLFPDALASGWSRSDYALDLSSQVGDSTRRGIWIPRKGATIRLTPKSWAIYNRVIRNYEGLHDNARLVGDKVYINGEPADYYTFKMDYYYMIGDNRDNSLDSRYWGFVPEDHVVGKPMLVITSFDKDKNIFNGGIRWNRVFRRPNPDK